MVLISEVLDLFQWVEENNIVSSQLPAYVLINIKCINMENCQSKVRLFKEKNLFYRDSP